MIQYYRSGIVGTDPSIAFAAKMRTEGFDRFEEAIEKFRLRFDDRFQDGDNSGCLRDSNWPLKMVHKGGTHSLPRRLRTY